MTARATVTTRCVHADTEKGGCVSSASLIEAPLPGNETVGAELLIPRFGEHASEEEAMIPLDKTEASTAGDMVSL
jgi:hypothetical protein